MYNLHYAQSLQQYTLRVFVFKYPGTKVPNFITKIDTTNNLKIHINRCNMSEFNDTGNNTCANSADNLYVKTYASKRVRGNQTISAYKQEQIAIFKERWNTFEQAVENKQRQNAEHSCSYSMSPLFGIRGVDKNTGDIKSTVDNEFIRCLDNAFEQYVIDLQTTGQKSQKKEALMFFFYQALKIVWYDDYINYLFRRNHRSSILWLPILTIVLKNIKFGEYNNISSDHVDQFIGQFALNDVSMYTLVDSDTEPGSDSGSVSDSDTDTGSDSDSGSDSGSDTDTDPELSSQTRCPVRIVVAFCAIVLASFFGNQR